MLDSTSYGEVCLAGETWRTGNSEGAYLAYTAATCRGLGVSRRPSATLKRPVKSTGYMRLDHEEGVEGHQGVP